MSPSAATSRSPRGRRITLDLESVAKGAVAALMLGLVAGFSPQATWLLTATQAASRQLTGLFFPYPSQLVHLSARSSRG